MLKKIRYPLSIKVMLYANFALTIQSSTLCNGSGGSSSLVSKSNAKAAVLIDAAIWYNKWIKYKELCRSGSVQSDRGNDVVANAPYG